MEKPANSENSKLFRGDTFPVSNLLSAFGADIKETRLSAMLGYLIHLNSQLPSLLFNIPSPLDAVHLEPIFGQGAERYDIVLMARGKRHVIEVKTGEHSPDQVRRYLRSNPRLYLIGGGLGSELRGASESRHFRDWDDVATALRKSKSKGRNANQFYNSLVDQFVGHLTEKNMILADRGDVYVRDLSGQSVDAYFKHNIYRFQPKFFESSRQARYFAPYLTRSNRRGERQTVYSILGVGISFMSKVIHSSLVEEREIASILRSHDYSREGIAEIFEMSRWRKAGKTKRALFLLEDPMRLFLTPITKVDLWGIPGGAMPPMCIDFGDLVAAANGRRPLAKKHRRGR